MCGAAGLVYGVAAAIWVGFVAIAQPMRLWQRALSVGSTLLTPAYIAIYMQGYARPAHHPKSAGYYESARIGLESQVMAFGPPAQGLWEVGFGLVTLAIGLLVVGQLVIWIFGGAARTRAIGLFLLVGAAGAVAFGIGWGRSGMVEIGPDAVVSSKNMGFAWRYGWLTAPAVWVAYFTCLVRGGRVSLYGPALLAAFAAILFPINEVSGFRLGENRLRPFEDRWEADVRAGWTAPEVFAQGFPDIGDPFRAEVIAAMRLMRDRRYAYYEFLGADAP
jgi:hypothetical protein